jgi:superfamily II DNA helicase RecQ
MEKSLIPAITAILRSGISIVLVPLHGLGSDQVESAENYDFGVEAYYVDEHRFANAKSLQDRLKHYSKEEAEENTIILYVSLNSIREYSNSEKKRKNDWFPIFYSLAKGGLISLLAIDEAHAVEQADRSFRREFIDAVISMKHLFDVMPHPVPRLAMSATFRREYYDRIVSLFGLEQPIVLQGDLSRRRTHFHCYVVGSPADYLLKNVTTNVRNKPTNQHLMYCNSRHTCENSFCPRLLVRRQQEEGSSC